MRRRLYWLLGLLAWRFGRRYLARRRPQLRR
jgi:hypothetical protein